MGCNLSNGNNDSDSNYEKNNISYTINYLE